LGRCKIRDCIRWSSVLVSFTVAVVVDSIARVANFRCGYARGCIFLNFGHVRRFSDVLRWNGRIDRTDIKLYVAVYDITGLRIDKIAIGWKCRVVLFHRQFRGGFYAAYERRY
jgi:hypothetical protein